MPAATLSKAQLLDRLPDTFRRLGYDGASLADISAATGLGKSSLYHHFPGGKEEMGVEVLAHLANTLEEALFAPLKTPGDPRSKLSQMLDVIDAFYDGGRKACLLARLAASADRTRFQRPLRSVFERWSASIVALGREAGLSQKVAEARAEDAIVRIEGALVVCAGTDDVAPFTRALSAIRGSLLEPAR